MRLPLTLTFRDCCSRVCGCGTSTLAGLMIAVFVLAGCTPKPLIQNSVDTPPLVLLPASVAGTVDGRARFREIFCAVTEKARSAGADDMPCERALVRLESEGPPTGEAVDLAARSAPLKVMMVFGLGWECVKNFVDPQKEMAVRLSGGGRPVSFIEVETLSSSARNAGLIREAVMAMPPSEDDTPLVLVGYSKGTPDILEAVAAFPELQQRVAAVVSIAGAVGGSPLANDAPQWLPGLLQHFPRADCRPRDGGALESLKPEVRRRWLADHRLPASIRYYSVVTYPGRDRISSLLQYTYRKLSQVDARNDGMLIFYDQVIPGSVLLGYLNADHWAAAVPLNRSHPALSAALADQNAFPREVLIEAVLRYVREDLSRARGAGSEPGPAAMTGAGGRLPH